MDISLLEYIINKSPVIDTYSAENLINEPNLVVDKYESHLKTYIKVDDEEFDKRFIREIKKGKTVKGYISAPYGYGKTSKALSLWDYCKKNNILAIPPFKFDGKLDTIMDAVYGWTRYVYKLKYPEYLDKIEKIYRKYKGLSIEKEIEYLMKNRNLTENEAKEIVYDLLNRGKLIVSITPKDLMNFLKEMNEIIKEHFEGMAIFVDEVQGIKNMEIINNLRNFIFELSINNIGLGILFIIPDYQEEDLNIRAGDLIDRLRKDGFYLNLVNIYSVNFAEDLWKKYGELLQFNPYDIITEDCLRSIGEISSREDLGKGPRTVIGAFKCACMKYKEKFEPYTVFDFINDILNGEIKFIHQKFLDALNEGLSLKKVDSDKKRKVIKLVGAFPRGISEEKIKDYGLYDEYEELSRFYYGTEIVYALEGYTLKGLLKGETATYVEQHIRKFRSIFNESWEGEMIDAFITYILPEIFPRKKGSQIMGWRIDEKYPIVGGYYHQLTGTFNPKYPFRTIGVYSLRYDTNEKENTLVDVEFRFILDKNCKNNDLVIDYRNGEVIFRFNVLKKVGEDKLPGDLKKLQQYVKPQEVTPMFMLCLLNYFDKIKEKEDEYAKHESEINALKSILIRYLKRFLFSDDLVEKYNLRKRQEKIVEEVFNRICEYKFRDYSTLIHSPNWHKDLERYRILLNSLSISKRRGEEFETTKKKLVSILTGSKNPNVAGFKEECEYGKWKDLINLKHWGKDEKIRVELKKHPLEEMILKEFIEKWIQPISVDEIVSYGMSLGYIPEEVEEILKILESRRYIEINKGYVFKSREITNTDVLNKFDEVENLAKKVVTLYMKYGKNVPNILVKHSKREEIKQQTDPDLLYKELEIIESWEKSLKEYLKTIENEIKNDKEELINKVLKIGEKIDDLKNKIDNIKEEIIKTHYSLGGIVRHLEEQIKITKKKCNKISKDLLILKEKINSTRDLEPLAECLNEAKKTFKNLNYEYEDVLTKYNKFKSWLGILRKLEELYEKIDVYRDYIDIKEEHDKFNELIEDIIQGFAREGADYLDMDRDVEEDIKLIDENIKKKERNLRNEFNKIQEEIRTKMNILAQTLKPLNIQHYSYREAFSIEDRETAYQNLVRNVKSYIKEVVDKLNDQVNHLKAEVELRLNNNENYISKLKAIGEEVENIDIEVIDKDNLMESVEEIKSKILDIWENLEKVRKEIKREIIERSKSEKSEEEIKIIEILNKYGEIPIEKLSKYLNMDIEGTLKWLLKMENVEIIVRKK
ncbi:hypothetical protein MFS40622_0132 [Methanocaldococcus sp. FS406-22]|uniref:hypothetical protein n=1 Tax=Methanocaldococcus sp. (strain FS406-22) TaxID=644281 RepID=UPI0001BF579D|nr:hypothetical protein [Methanocaldococcus sp. FS406-22]ADC68832.1 hypothetical protein MFS40622_0132 [Methanocaldococcus sp. FS406-22]